MFQHFCWSSFSGSSGHYRRAAGAAAQRGAGARGGAARPASRAGGSGRGRGWTRRRRGWGARRVEGGGAPEARALEWRSRPTVAAEVEEAGVGGGVEEAGEGDVC
jgi:hypothetical protein